MGNPITSRGGGGGGGGATTVDGLTDATITGTPADNEVLAYDTGSGEWINQTAAEAGLATSGHAHAINDLSDVTISGTPADNELLAYDTGTGEFINQTAAEAGITSGIANVVEDTTPQLGGALDTNSFSINPLLVVGDADEVQLQVTGNATQTSSLFNFKNATNSAKMYMDTNGQVVIDSDVGAGSTPLTIKYNGATLSAQSFGGTWTSKNFQASTTSGYLLSDGYGAWNTLGTSGQVKAYNNIVLTPDAGGTGEIFLDAVTAASPQSRVLNATGGSGTNIAGAKLVLAGGKGTGTGAPGNLEFQTSFPIASGSSLQTLATRSITFGPVTLTESSATAVCTSIGVASGTVTGGTFHYTIEANDGTDYQVLRGQVPFCAVNKAGTLTTTLGTPVEITAVSTGTLSTTVTVTTGTNTIILNQNAVSSLTQTVLRCTGRVVLDGGTGAWTA